MEAKDKAIELYSKFRNENSVMTANVRAKKQALICVEESLKSLEKLLMDTYTGCYIKEISRERDFYEEVKEHLINMK